MSCTGDPSIADDLCQEFAIRFLRGDFRHVRSEKGRFRDYLRTSLFHLVDQHRRRANRREWPSDSLAAVAITVDSPDREFEDACRRELINQAWAVLTKRTEKGIAPSHHDILKQRADMPNRSSSEWAAEWSQKYGRKFTAENVRQLTHRAREQFAKALRSATAEMTGTDSPQEVEDELAVLNLLIYCQG